MFESESESRDRTLTEKGFEYQLSVAESNFKSSLSAWRRHYGQALSLISDSQNTSVIKQHRNLITESLENLTTAFDKLKSFKEDIDMEGATFDKVELEHQEILKQISSRVRDLETAEDDAGSYFSRKSCVSAKSNVSNTSRKSRVSKSSQRSNVSKLSEAAARKAMLQAELEYVDVESRVKAEYERIRLMKQMAIAQAQYDALNVDDYVEPLKTNNMLLPSSKNDEISPQPEQDMVTQKLSGMPDISNIKIEAPRSFVKVDQISSPAVCHGSTVLHSSPFVSSAVSSSTLNPNADKFVSQNHPSYTNTQFTWSHGPQQIPISNPHTHVKTLFKTEFQPSDRKTSLQNSTNNQNPDLLHIVDAFARQINLSRLPTPEPGIFSGNPLEYPGWKAAFQTLIEKSNIPPSERIYYLKRYLSESVKEVVEGCFLLCTDDAYEQAKHTLDSRYGDQFVISNAFRDKLERWPKIQSRDSKGLQRYSDFLLQCQIAMQSISSLRVLNDDRENKKLLSKLPDWLIVRWARIVSNWKDSKGQFPSFQEFAQFVANEARIANDPITSLQSQKTSDEGKTFKSSSKRPERKLSDSRSFQLKATEDPTPKANNIKCHICQGSHDLDECSLFLNKSLLDRKAFIREKRLCYACFGDDHISRKCKQRKQCKICSKHHPSSLHGDVRKLKDSPPLDKPNVQQGTPAPSKCGAAFLSYPNACKVSMVVPVLLSHEDRPEREVLVYAMLDTQSDTTFVLEKSCKALGLVGVDVKLSLSTLYAENRIVDSKKINGLQVRGLGTEMSISLPEVFTRSIMPANRSHIPTPEVARSIPHLEHIAECLYPQQDCDIGLLIGYNCARALIPREIIAPVDDGPFAQRTDLGWGIVGLIDDCQSTDELSGPFDVGSCHRVLTCEVPNHFESERGIKGKKHVHFSLKTKVKEIFDYEKCLKVLESDFVESKQEGAVSCYDKRFVEIMNNETTCVNGRYEMPLPFCKDAPLLPNNRDMALKRLNGLKRRLKDDSKYREHYFTFMKNLIERGHAEKVATSSIQQSHWAKWYIPHHGVYHPQKPNKVRVVFDCSAKYCGKSLNEHLLTGPDLTNLLVGVLCRFRKENIAFMCDIEQMFYQFKVKTEHRDYLRFLWFEGEDIDSSPIDYRMTVHLFGASSSPGCANFALKKIATDNELDFGADVTDFVHRNFYVDDGLKSVNTARSAVELITKAQNMLARAGVRLCKFISNSDEVTEQIKPEDRASTLNSSLLDKNNSIERALGVLWCVQSDTLQFRVLLQDRPFTRRGVLSTVCSVYDPLGLIAPVILSGKQILQSLCADNFGWDEPLPDSLRDRWIEWRESISSLSDLKISRCLKPLDFGAVKSVQLHHFSDASSQGYGQCSYIRFVNQRNKVHCSLLMAKSRVVPLKPITIPRLELNAALISVKISTLLERELGFENVEHIYWTDSKIVLGYISNEAKRFHVFVANRVQKIKDHTKLSQWHHVSSNDNPADIASRGATAVELTSSKKWFDGPAFLWEQNIKSCNLDAYDIEPDDSEVKRVKALVTRSSQHESPSLIDRLRYFSDWQQAKRAVAVCLRYMKRLCDPTLVKPKRVSSITYVRENLLSSYQPASVGELQEAENIIIRKVQEDSFNQEIKDLNSNKIVGVPQSREEQSSRHKTLKGSKLYKLDPFIDSSGILRVGGRLKNAQLSDLVKHPVLLPKLGHLTDLIVRHCHKRTNHQGRGMTINQIRESGYWVIGCSSVVSNLISRCVICRRFRGSLQFQKMADLPSDRLESVPPFTYVGVDLFGPWLVRDGRKELKRYGVIFTCLCCRAVHLETANSLDTSSFVNALRRFIALRGPIRQLRCDRGTNFIGAERELNEAIAEMDESKVNFFLREQGCDYISFKTNVPSASHMGGIWERQIRSVRNVLSILLRQNGSHLDDESLRTFMCEASAIVNCRPLTVDNLNDPSSALPLSPNALLTMKSAVVLPPPGNFQKTDLYSRRRWRRVQFLLNEFWNRWKVEFLQNLQPRNKWTTPQRNVSVGDIVIIKDENLIRNEWRLGRVVETVIDNDGMVRKVKIALADANLDKNGKRVSPCSFLERPIHKLIILLETEEFPVKEPSLN